jgi:HlyD family secretion protein
MTQAEKTTEATPKAERMPEAGTTTQAPKKMPQAPKKTPQAKKWFLRIGIAFAAAGVGYFAWQRLKPPTLPPDIARANGRIEATEIDIAAKLAGRIKEILVDEGDFVKAGQVLVRMDTASLEAQRLEAEAQLRRAQIAIETAKSLVTEREAEKAAAQATQAQYEADLDGAQRRLTRMVALVPKGAASQQELDDDRAKVEAVRAEVNSAKAQVAASDAAIGTAREEVFSAQAQVEAGRATIERIQADINDSILIAPREGRVQYRVAEPGEVLGAGGKVVNMVDLNDVYMTFFLPTDQAGRVGIGTDVHLVLDAIPQFIIPAEATFVANVAQFTPKTVETAVERQKLTFRVKAHIPPELLKKYIQMVKTGLPGVAYVLLAPRTDWPPNLKVKLPESPPNRQSRLPQ